MKNKIKYICKNCNHIELEKRNIKTISWHITKSILLFCLLFTSLLGSTATYNFIVGGVWEKPNQMLQIGESYAFLTNIQSHFQSSGTRDELREIALNLTKNCNEDECKAKAIYNELLTFDYLEENATDLDPIKTWESREGDCDMMSYLYLSLLKQVQDAEENSIKSRISCTQTHCWNIVYLDDKKIIVDIINYGWREHGN